MRPRARAWPWRATGLALAASCSAPTPVEPSRVGPTGERPDPRRAVAEVLDDFHRAASTCDLERYLGHFSAAGVFIGTDASERWSREEFRAFCEPYFSRGRGWTYVAIERHVQLSSDARSAWFDERLDNEKYGEVRGSGVLTWDGGAWRIEHYVMSFPVPNELASEWLRLLRGGPEKSP